MSTLLSRLALTFPPLFTALGAFAFDFNETHIHNPNWPPHARFHKGQTMSMSVTSCIACICLTWWRLPLHLAQSSPAAKDVLVMAWVAGSGYCVTGLTAILYPGSSGVDPEFFEEGVGDFPQKWIFGLPLLVNTAAFLWEWKKLEKEKMKTS